MKITTADIAKAGRTTVRGVHIWDSQRMLGTIERDASGARVFGPKHARMARLIAAGQMVGMSLAEIRARGVTVTQVLEAIIFLQGVSLEIMDEYDL